MTLNSGEELPIPLSYVWARIFVRPVSLIGGGQCRFSEKPINWYHIMTKDENSLELHEVQRSTGPANQKFEPHRYKKIYPFQYRWKLSDKLCVLKITSNSEIVIL